MYTHTYTCKTFQCQHRLIKHVYHHVICMYVLHTCMQLLYKAHNLSSQCFISHVTAKSDCLYIYILIYCDRPQFFPDISTSRLSALLNEKTTSLTADNCANETPILPVALLSIPALCFCKEQEKKKKSIHEPN